MLLFTAWETSSEAKAAWAVSDELPSKDSTSSGLKIVALSSSGSDGDGVTFAVDLGVLLDDARPPVAAVEPAASAAEAEALDVVSFCRRCSMPASRSCMSSIFLSLYFLSDAVRFDGPGQMTAGGMIDHTIG